MVAVVERHVHARLGAGVQQPRAVGIGADGLHVRLGRYPRIGAGPMRASVAGAIDVGREVIEAVTVHRGIRDRRIERRRFEQTDSAPGWQALGRDVLPVLAAVRGAVNQAVVRADPDEPRRARRRGDRVHHTVAARRGVRDGGRARVGRRRTAGGPRQVGADRLPVQPAVPGAQHHLCAVVERVAVHAVEHERRRPRETVPPLRHRYPEARDGPGRDVL